MNNADRLQAVRDQLEKDLPKLPLGDLNEPTVPGDGNPNSELLFIGEAPGYNESLERKPFVGRSGKLFIKTLAEVGFPRETVYITNIVKVRPPENRDPLPAEIAAYRTYLDQEIEILQPKLVITLGRLSIGKFLPEVKISQVHGRLHRVKWKGTTLFVLPMYHPAAALRNPQTSASFVNDFQKIPKILEWMKAQAEGSELEETVREALF